MVDLIGAHNIAVRTDSAMVVVLCFETQIKTPKHVIGMCNKGMWPRLEGFCRFDGEEDSLVAGIAVPESDLEELQDGTLFGGDDGVWGFQPGKGLWQRIQFEF